MAMTLTPSSSPPTSPSSSITANKSMAKIIVIVLIVILMTFFNSTLNDVTKNVQKHHEIYYYEKQHQDYYYQQQQKLQQAFENANPNENETTTRTTKPITKTTTEVVAATAANNSNDEAPPPYYYQQQEQQQPSATATKAITKTTEKSEAAAAAAAAGGGGGISVTTATTSQSPSSSSSSSFSWPYPDHTPDDIWIYWIHVGKAGGVSLRDGLPIREGQKKVLRSCMMKYVATATKTTTTTTTTNNSNIANRPDDNTTTTTNNATTTNATTTTTTSMTMKDANTKCYPSSSQKGGTALSKHILAGFHMWGGQYDDTEKNWVLENTNALLFSVRNPIDRIISAYGYHYNEYFTLSKWEINHNVSLVDKIEKNKQSRRVASQFYFDCFPSLDDLCLSMVQYYHFHHPLLNDTTTVNNTTGNNTKPALSEQCMDLGRRILEGWNSGRYLPHFNYNYRSYLQRTYYYSDNNQQKRQQRPRHGKIIMTTNERRRRPRPPPRRHDVVVIRTEHMWNDTAKLDIVLGGNGTKDFIKPNHQHTHNSQTLSAERRKISQDLLINSNSSSSNGNHYSSLPKIAICCAIYKDLDAYQAIVLLAKNLNIQEKQQTLQLLFDDCGVGGGIKAPLPPILFRPDDDNDNNDNGSYSASYFAWQEWYDSTCLLK